MLATDLVRACTTHGLFDSFRQPLGRKFSQSSEATLPELVSFAATWATTARGLIGLKHEVGRQGADPCRPMCLGLRGRSTFCRCAWRSVQPAEEQRTAQCEAGQRAGAGRLCWRDQWRRCRP